MPNIAHTK